MDRPKVSVDVPRVTTFEARTLMIHHLSLAASYYEATDADQKGIISDFVAQMHDASAEAATAWLKAIDAYYEGL